jgi:uncharacterized protein YgbK (DUF1537 family)
LLYATIESIILLNKYNFQKNIITAANGDGEIQLDRLLVLADDLTGANDTGLQFAKKGYKTIVLLDMEKEIPLANGAEVLVANTDSRSLVKEEAIRRVKEKASSFRNLGYSVVYKKIDSTLRGHIGSEVEAVLESFSFEFALVVPAYPENGRVTLGGYHIVNHVPLEKTEIASDPKFPVTESNVIRLLEKQTDLKTGHIQLSTILKGKEAIESAIRLLIQKNVKIIVCDASSEEDLFHISQAGKCFSNILWVGSAGLANNLSEVFTITANDIEPERCSKAIYPSKEISTYSIPPCVIVAGSLTETTRRQMEALVQESQIVALKIDPVKLADSKLQKSTIKEVIEKGIRQLQNKEHFFITIDKSAKSRSDIDEFKRTYNLSSYDVGEQIAYSLGEMVAGLVSKTLISGLVLTGGDIAAAVCKSLGSAAIQVLEEVETGIPIGKIIGGHGDGFYVITKAGAFGSDRVFLNAIEHLASVYKQQCNQC